MFLQACVTHSVQRGGGGGQHQWSTTSPHLGLGHSTPPPPPGLGLSTPPPTWNLITPPRPLPPPVAWSLHPTPPLPHLGLGHSTPAPPPGTWSLHPTPHLGLGHSTLPLPHLGLGRSTPPHLGLGHSTPPPPPPHLGLGHNHLVQKRKFARRGRWKRVKVCLHVTFFSPCPLYVIPLVKFSIVPM